jgi:predicted nucleic acid-binding protein
LIVLDASAVLEVLLGTARGARIGKRIFRPAQGLHAPHLIDLEVAQVLRRYVASGEVSAERAGHALEDLADVPLHRYPHDVLLPRIWELRHNATAYDAAYLVLAEALPAPLVTCDGRLASVPGTVAKVEVF